MIVSSTVRRDVLLEVAYGDIAAQPDVSAVVNAANAHMAPGGGVSGAIHRGAGPALWEECRKLTPLKPGEVAITGAYSLPNDYVIHCLGPRYGIDEPADKLLESCYRGALKLCEERNIDSIAFPAISTGAFYYPWKEAVTIAWSTILDHQSRALKRGRMVLHDQPTAERTTAILERLLNR